VIEIDRAGNEAQTQLIDGLTRVLGDVRAAVEDWRRPCARSCRTLADRLGAMPHARKSGISPRPRNRWCWLERDNFTSWAVGSTIWKGGRARMLRQSARGADFTCCGRNGQRLYLDRVG
jgi:NAD-specific glutamate dehydrogenase